LDKIKISSYDKTTTVTMPRIRDITDNGDNVYNEATMASGRKVRDIVGYRPAFKANWDWVPASTLTTLLTLIRSGTYLYIEYPDPVDGDSAGFFDVSYPTPAIFMFINGEPMWHNVSLTFTGQEVV